MDTLVPNKSTDEKRPIYRLSPFKIAAYYAAVGVLWIIFSDAVVGALFKNPATITEFSAGKGLAYVILTAILLYWMIKKYASGQERTEARLRRSEERFSKAFRNSPDAIVLSFLRDGRIIEVNDSFMSMSGYGLDEVIGRTSIDLDLWANPDERQQYVKLLKAQGNVKNIDVDFRIKSGKIINCLLSGETVDFTDGQHVISVIRNVTETKKAEKELNNYKSNLEMLVDKRTRELQETQLELMNLVGEMNIKTEELASANERLMELDRLKSMFIASMSHEFRTPLNAIIGFSSILHDEWSGHLNNEQKEETTAIIRAGRHLLSLVNEVIDISKIEAGMLAVEIEDFELNELMNEAADSIRKDASAKDKDIKIIIQPIRQRMHTDRKRLLQCLLNLIGNAVKFTMNGEICISARLLTAGSDDEKQLEVTVADTGIGIAQEDIPKLFEPFIRLQGSYGIQCPGTGLGLYLSRRLAREVLGGDITVASEYGKGSTFNIRIPLRPA